jgi:hypothetical protein
MKKIKLNDWATLSVMSKEEYEREYGDEDQEQQSPTTDLDNDPDINPRTDVIGDKETSEQLADVLKRMTRGEVRRSVRNLDQLHISERKATEAANPESEATRTSETSEALVAAMQRAREAKSKE